MAAAAKDKGRKKIDQTRGQPQQWADLFRRNSKPSSSFKLKKWSEEEREITKDELRNLGFCLVGYILGRFPGRQAIDQVRQSWQVQSNLTLHDSGWLIFSFNTEADRDSVMEKGPYETLGAAWILKKLPQFFKFDDDCFSLIPTWVRLHGLPLDFWTVNALGKIASSIGEPLAADECTALMSKTSFARLLVEVDVTKDLIREVSFSMPNGAVFVQQVSYEREPKLCKHCKLMGHLQTECRKMNVKQSTHTADPLKVVQQKLNTAASTSHLATGQGINSMVLQRDSVQEACSQQEVQVQASLPCESPPVMLKDKGKVKEVYAEASEGAPVTAQDPSCSSPVIAATSAEVHVPQHQMPVLCAAVVEEDMTQ